MRISVCPKCYESGEINEGIHINNCDINGEYYAVFWCKECKDSYKEK